MYRLRWYCCAILNGGRFGDFRTIYQGCRALPFALAGLSCNNLLWWNKDGEHLLPTPIGFGVTSPPTLNWRWRHCLSLPSPKPISWFRLCQASASAVVQFSSEDLACLTTATASPPPPSPPPRSHLRERLYLKPDAQERRDVLHCHHCATDAMHLFSSMTLDCSLAV